MRPSSRVLACLAFAALGAASGCSSCRREPAPRVEARREVVTAFYTGLSAMQTSQEVLARQQFERVMELAPEEPAGWANVGLLLLRQQDIEQASTRLARAAELAPASGEIQRLQALAAGRQGNLAEAIRHWRRALELDPDDDESAYALALEIERQGGAEHDAEAQRVLEGLLARSDNLAARVEHARLAAKRGDATALTAAMAALDAVSSAWSPAAQAQLKELQGTTADNSRATATRVLFLKNLLLREPAYRAALAELTTPRSEVGRPLMRFLVLANPDPRPAAVDEALAFTTEAVPNAGAGRSLIRPIWLTGEGGPVLLAAGPEGAQLLQTGADGRVSELFTYSGGGGSGTAHGVAAADLNYDYLTDLVLAGPSGLRLLRQGKPGQFSDITDTAGLPPALRASAHGVWPADVDTDGDLDLVVALLEGAPRVLRNNGDGTFQAQEPFAGITRVRDFVWADLDGEGVPDAAFLSESGAVHLFVNLRGGAFRQEPLPPKYGQAAAIVAAELSGDALFDLLVLARDGTLTRLSRRPEDGSWDVSELSRLGDALGTLLPGAARLVTGDLDNNGALDVIASSSAASRVLLRGPGSSFAPAGNPPGLGVQAAADLDGDGRLELVGLLADGRPARAVSKGAKPYRWQALRTRSATATGDQRINSFGIGGEIELRTGLHVQKQPITTPVVHFGIGEADRAEVIRITWPNGVLQSEFEAAADATVAATQRLKGSCPWLFAWNGREMGFVTDLIWRSPLGLRINAQATADVLMTEDWVKVRGDQLAPRAGAYDLRITAELWETHFFDLTSLLAVDHPEGTEVFVDERFTVVPQPLRVITTGAVRPFAAVRDDRGRDAAATVATRDSRHLDFAGRGPYQGITRPHFVEIELPEEAPRAGPLWLVGRGWVHPTDSSINVAITQGAHAAPESLSLHVADRDGRFRAVRTGLGFPAGKDKTVLIDLSGLFPADGPRRLRLATNLEVFWDQLGWAVGRPDVPVAPRRVDLVSADLSDRGYSVTEQPDQSHPERPKYVLEGTAPRWLDLEGYYTRYGDVRELLTAVDDRYVIMNAGDEIRLKFREVAAPAPGLVRDFVMIGDGWVKDGDFNTGFSRTVLPLPTHRSGRYDRPPGRPEDDPVQRRNARDFAEYHTRYVSPAAVRDALRAPGDGR